MAFQIGFVRAGFTAGRLRGLFPLCPQPLGLAESRGALADPPARRGADSIILYALQISQL